VTDIRTGNLPNASLDRYSYINLHDDIKMIPEETVYMANFRVDADEHTHMYLLYNAKFRSQIQSFSVGFTTTGCAVRYTIFFNGKNANQ
jgi:hypothetical protein